MIPSQYLDLCIQLNGVCRWSGDDDDDEKRQKIRENRKTIQKGLGLRNESKR